MQLEVAPERLVWVAPGGGLMAGELPSEGAVREVLEETGREIEAGIPVWTRTHTFEFEGRLLRQREIYFLARVDRFDPRTDGFESVEQRLFRGFHWWHVDAIRGSEALFAPRGLGDLLRDLLSQGPPATPIDVGV